MYMKMVNYDDVHDTESLKNYFRHRLGHDFDSFYCLTRKIDSIEIQSEMRRIIMISDEFGIMPFYIEEPESKLTLIFPLLQDISWMVEYLHRLQQANCDSDLMIFIARMVLHSNDLWRKWAKSGFKVYLQETAD